MSKYRKIQISIEYPSRKIVEFNIHRDDRYNIDLSFLKKIGEAEIKKIQKDHEQLGMFLSKYPGKMLEILDDVLVGNLDSAKEKAKAIGFTEEHFQTKSGGIFWWVVAAVVVGILLYPSEAK